MFPFNKLLYVPDNIRQPIQRTQSNTMNGQSKPRWTQSLEYIYKFK